MYSATAIQNLPTMYPPLGSNIQKANAKATTSTTGTSSTNTVDLQTTFLNLLSQELQNQDPTDPVDSTQMVGQMISLNQLDQLISINQTLNEAAALNPAAATGAIAKPAAAARDSARPANDAPLGMALSPAAGKTSWAHSLPFDPATMMPWNLSNPSEMAPSPSVTGTGAINTINLNSGGK